MRTLAGFRKLVPARHKHRLRALHRKHVLGRGIRRAAGNPPYADLPDQVIEDLIYGWGNEMMAAKLEFIRGITRQSWRADGPILECGSGLSTLVAGLIAHVRETHIWSLENDPVWAARAEAVLARSGVECVTFCLAPLRDFGDYTWYDISQLDLPSSFDLVICDGPQGDTHGGRYGLLPQCIDRLQPGCTIVLDDAQRAGEREVLDRWASEFATRHEFTGTDEMIATIRVPERNAS